MGSAGRREWALGLAGLKSKIQVVVKLCSFQGGLIPAEAGCLMASSALVWQLNPLGGQVSSDHFVAVTASVSGSTITNPFFPAILSKAWMA